MSAETWFGFAPTHEQIDALGDLIDRLAERTRGIDDAARLDPVPTRESRNVLACLGPRGAGKSTLLSQLARSGNGGRRAHTQVLGDAGVHVAALIDCSALPQEVSPGAAILVELLEDDALWSRMPKDAHGRLNEQLRVLSENFATVDPSYRELCVELSTTPQDFPQFVTEGIALRLRLQRQLADWLKQACHAAGVQSLVVLLDDFDLVPGPQVRAWLQALLDAFHQWRLLFVIGADPLRLQHLSFDPKAELDDVTARALLQKVLPESNQVHLEPFQVKTREEFTPGGERGRSGLRDLLHKGLPPDLVPHERALLALLPHLPRGLVNLYEAVEAWTPKKDARNRRPRRPGVEGFLSLLASCRGEPLLARRLEEVAAADWVKRLHWGRRPASIEAWRETVRAATESGATARGLPALDPPRLRPKPSRRQDPLEHNPAWSDPLRHDLLIRDQLRDSHPAERARWVELLLNVSLDASTVRRAMLVRAWPATRERVEGARLRLALSPAQVWAFFEPSAETRPLLPWMAFVEESADGERWIVDVGWFPLLNVLRGARDPWPAELLARLFIAPDDVSGELQPQDPESGLRILPARVRPLILLVDALSRCPWRAFAAPTLGWSLMTYLRLAGAFVRTAYLHALGRANLLHATIHPGPAQRQFLDQLRRADPHLRASSQTRREDLNRLEEDQVVRLLAALAEEDPLLLLASEKDDLCRAARSFLESPAYRALGLTKAPAGGAPTRAGTLPPAPAP